jgi:hypothetical protein
MTKKPAETNQIRDFIVETIKTKQPETTDKLVELLQQKYALSREELFQIILQLESTNKINFSKKKPPPATLSAYVFSLQSAWYWLTIILSVTTCLAIFTIAENDYPLVYLRQGLGILFVLFLPGYAFIKTFYPSNAPIATSSGNMDAVERLTFSLGLSITLTAITGLVLNYTPWGIRLTPITLSLLSITVIFATVAIVRELSEKNNK